jgi:hypothetical protein
LIRLSFPEYNFSIKEAEGRSLIFDPVRKKFVVLTPEEWVRQHVIRYLIEEKAVPPALMRSEGEIVLNRTRKRFDVAVFTRNGKALLAVECKAPGVAITQEVLDQAIRYNMTLRVRFLVLSNGLQNLVFEIGADENKLKRLADIPVFGEMIPDSV